MESFECKIFLKCYAWNIYIPKSSFFKYPGLVEILYRYQISVLSDHMPIKEYLLS